VEQRRIGGWIGARDTQVRAAAKMNPADVLDGERRDVIEVPLHQPLESVANTQHVDPGELRPDGRCRDDAVDSRRGTAADEDCESLMMFHVSSLYYSRAADSCTSRRSMLVGRAGLKPCTTSRQPRRHN